MNQNDNQDDLNLEDLFDEEEEQEEEESSTVDEEEEEEIEEEEEEDKKPEKVEDDPRIPAKFKGKTAAEIAEAYTNLESHMNTKAIEIAQQLLGGQKPNKDAVKENEVEDDFGLTEEELKNMSPKDFLNHVNKTITERAQKIVADTMARTTEVRTAVKRDVRDAVKVHPHLKTNKQYRDIVIDMIDAAAARGKHLSLKDACKRADEAMNIKAEPAKPPEKPKKPRTGVERTDGVQGDDNLDEEDKVKAGILGGHKSTGLGGLGV